MIQSLISLLTVAMPGIAMACHPLPPPGGWVDDPVVVLANGAFDFAGPGYGSLDLDGAAPVDLGDGMVGQRLTWSSVCRDEQVLLFIDCVNGAVAAVDGLEDPDRSGIEENRYIDLVQAPLGALPMADIKSAAAFVDLATAAGYDVTSDYAVTIAGFEPQNRFNPFYACELLYPDLPGALSK